MSDMGKDVIAVEPIGGTRLILTFEGGERRTIDVSDLVRPVGVFARIQDPAFFASVRVNPEIGTIVWPNGADLCPDVLYQQSRSLSTSAA